MSIIKYLSEKGPDKDPRGPLFWGRAKIDGAPFRGTQPPLLRDEEFRKLAERVYDAGVKVFRLWEPDELEEYTLIVDRIINNYYRPIRREYLPVPEKNSFAVLLEWGAPRMEIDPHRLHSIAGPAS